MSGIAKSEKVATLLLRTCSKHHHYKSWWRSKQLIVYYNCQNSQYDVKVAGYNGDVDERRDGHNFAFNYGFNI